MSGTVKSENVKWTDIVSKLPDLKYLLPSDLDQLVKRLRDDPTLIVEPDDEAPPLLIGSVK